jgi:cyclophilin family peptidyl-prolyl cis-trans isomerase
MYQVRILLIFLQIKSIPNMKKIKILLLSLLLISSISLIGQVKNDSKGTKVSIETSLGNIILILYDETPLHRDNFIKLVKEGYYDNQLFHRVIKDFMVQGGDPNSKNANRGEMLGIGGPKYTLPAEFNSSFYHKKGALAAARKGDDVNPQKASSGSQFYIVQGRIYSQSQLNNMVTQGSHPVFTPQQIKDYTTIGGTPNLDGSYTVFGEVIQGIDVIEKIANLPVDAYKRPLEDIKFTMMIIK